MTNRALQTRDGFWGHWDEVDPDDENTDWKTNLQVRRDGPDFKVTVVDNVHKEIAVHRIGQDQLMSLVRWLANGPDLI